MPVETPGDLYGLPLDQFTAERDALAGALRAAGQRSRADEVKQLRKPTAAAWAVNQLVRSQPTTARRLFDAGDRLIAAQQQAVSGQGGAESMRDAARQLRDALDELTRAARGLLSSQGNELAQSTIERVTETLRAAAIDHSSRERVEPACLTRELGFAGIGSLPTGVTAGPPAPRSAAAASEARKRRQAAIRAAEEEVRSTARELEHARLRLAQVEALREQAAAEVAQTENALQSARDALAELQREGGRR